MNNIDSATRGKFFPNSKTTNKSISKQIGPMSLKRNNYERQQELENLTGQDAKVSIPQATRDFSRIKKAVDDAPEIDNSDKIAKLKAQINAGTYKIDYEALADKVIAEEF